MPRFSPETARRGSAVAAKVNRQLRQEHDAAVLPTIRELRAQGKSLQEIGTQLTLRGFVTRQGLHYWDRRQVLRVLKRNQPVTLPEERMSADPSDGVTLPNEETTNGVTLPEEEAAPSVTLPVMMHHHGTHQGETVPEPAQHHGSQHEGTVPQADDGVRYSTETVTLPGSAVETSEGTPEEAASENRAGFAHLPTWLQQQMRLHGA